MGVASHPTGHFPVAISLALEKRIVIKTSGFSHQRLHTNLSRQMNSHHVSSVILQSDLISLTLSCRNASLIRLFIYSFVCSFNQ